MACGLQLGAWGLTFVELLMASTMFALLMVGLSTHLRGGMLAWRRATTTVEELQRRRVALDRLARDAANAVVIDERADAKPPIVFKADALEFFTLGQTPGLSQGERRVWFVTYAIEQDGQTGTLRRSARTIQEAQASLSVPSAPLLPNVERLSIRYGYRSTQGTPHLVWRDVWDDHVKLPNLMEITIAMKTATSLPSQLRRTIMIPSGIMKSEPAS
ncbi:MAG: hypothetical protein HYZ88_02635 [Candidatus Omnitrophica bacterium]|nr:hypothetical protein [Candidatus Omnitrophota bacterium]